MATYEPETAVTRYWQETVKSKAFYFCKINSNPSLNFVRCNRVQYLPILNLAASNVGA